MGEPPFTQRDKDEAARLAGWDPAWGPTPAGHTLPPAVDVELGHNGIAPTGAPELEADDGR